MNLTDEEREALVIARRLELLILGRKPKGS